MLVTFLCILGTAPLVVYSATISVLNPLDAQLPLIARVNQPYSWSFSSHSFVSSPNSSLHYTASMPAWLSFDSSTRTFSGTPTEKDQGTPEISVTASDSNSSISSQFNLCITSHPPPILRLPISKQFSPDNPALSSVFLLSPNSAIATFNPGLRVPPKWSFSVGLQGSTFTSANGLFYDALQADGSPLPPWMSFDSKTITLNGVTPPEQSIASPQVVSLALHASDQHAYTACIVPFDLIIAANEMSLASSLPTINITDSTPFNVTLTSSADFSGVLVDGKAIQPSEIVSLSIDTTPYDTWLNYDVGSRTLSGKPPSDLKAGQGPLLPVTLTSTFNQSIHANVSVAIVPSFFSASELPPVLSEGGKSVNFNLVQYFSNATAGHDGVNLTAVLQPKEAGDFLTFDPGNAQLTGMIPASFDLKSHITVTFTAYSQTTHSTSHASLTVSLSSSDFKNNDHSKHANKLSSSAHKRLVLALNITFGVIFVVVLFGGLLAAFRRCAKVKDTAIGGEEGRRAWTAGERMWYGIDVTDAEGRNAQEHEGGYGWTEKVQAGDCVNDSIHSDQTDLPTKNSFPPPVASRPQARGGYGNIGLGLRRMMSRTPSDPFADNLSQTGGVMRKGSFLEKIRDAVREVSAKYTRKFSSGRRPIISKPVLISTRESKVEGLPIGNSGLGSNLSVLDPFDDSHSVHMAPSSGTSLTGSPSSSTGGRSAPTRRADFGGDRFHGGPKEMAAAHVADSRIALERSNSSDSLASHAAEAVVHTATKAVSVRSEHSYPDSGGAARPRLVPFTSANRVPVPRSFGSLRTRPVNGSNGGLAMRVPSQTAQVFKVAREQMNKKDGEDELNVSMHYVRALGGDQRSLSGGSNSAMFYQSSPTISTNVRSLSRSSFSSLDSSHSGHRGSTYDDVNTVTRRVAMVGDNLTIRVPVLSTPLQNNLEAKLLSGEPLPDFLSVDWRREQKGSVKFSGTPTDEHVGLLSFGLYEKNGGVCVARVIIDIVASSK